MDDQNLCRSCIDCGAAQCRADGGGAGGPDFCLSANLDPEALREAMHLYTEHPENAALACAAAEVEADGYCKWTRVEEMIAFARRIGAKKLGIATCVGLIAEARTAARIFRAHGFAVYGVACKTGAQHKTAIGIPERCEAVGPNMCNPILQAKLLNAQHTDLNVVVGLCVGHDSLFYRYSEAPATTLVTKDRVLGHNPVAALYQANAYYRRLLEES